MNEKPKMLVFIPTYNEKDNVEKLFQGIMDLGPEFNVLFMDDNSPDGTGQLLDAMAANNNRLTVLHRSGKLGIGSAHREGIQWAYEHGVEVLVTMDSDLSHPPQTILTMLKEKDNADIVIASRYLLKDGMKGWSFFRIFLTKFGHLLLFVLLQLPFDAKVAFRLYKLKRIPVLLFDRVRSKGYSFFFESLFVLNYNKFKIVEVPLKSPVRTYGQSKMRLSDAWQSFYFLFVLFFDRFFNRKRFKV